VLPASLLVLPSPFLGAAAYRPLVEALRSAGAAAEVATYDEPPVADRVVERWAEQAAFRDDVVLVAHSNAGYLAPGVGARLGRTPIVFLDAALPPSEGSTALAPEPLRHELARLADPHGLLPRWTRWWSREQLAAVLPDPWFEQLDASVPRVPISYVDVPVTVPPGWEHGPRAYLALGPETYAAEIDRARSLGWPVRVLPGAGHLHAVVEPDETAASLLGLLSSLRR
jgi:hypothetical protein